MDQCVCLWHIAMQRRHYLLMQFLVKEPTQKVTSSKSSSRAPSGLVTGNRPSESTTSQRWSRPSSALAALRLAGVKSAVAEGPVPYDHHTNGAAEYAVKPVKGQFCTMLLGLERHLKARVPLDHPIITWLISHCGALRTLQVHGQDGRIANQRARGSSWRAMQIKGPLARGRARGRHRPYLLEVERRRLARMGTPHAAAHLP